MPIEIERKFLVSDDSWRIGAMEPVRITQGYFSRQDRLIGRVRKIGGRAFLAIKEKKVGLSRHEFEYETPNEDAEEMLALFCKDALIHKDRFTSRFDGKPWTIDVFDGDNKGLVVAEIELESENEKVSLPTWIGADITGVARYRNSNLARFPFQAWSRPEDWTGRQLESLRAGHIAIKC
ncbi:CYTH domain-containing protein [Sphingomonas sp. DBB INV C78]|uniref:CYTH domain-containing protein n=1 Tax=Sphingomonas sp. DBB INV C78 TaxID=3349434 RepID=UPI0036D3B7D2